MTRSKLVEACKELIRDAYEHATEMIVAYLEEHPDEPRKTLCREIDPENHGALDKRVARLQEKRRSEGDSTVTSGKGDKDRRSRAKWELKAALKRTDISVKEKARAVAAAIDELPDEEKGELADELAHIDVVQNAALTEASKEQERSKERRKESEKDKPKGDLPRVLERTRIRFAIRDAEKAADSVLTGWHPAEMDDDDADAFDMYAGRAYTLGDLLRNLATAIRENQEFDIDAELEALLGGE